MHNQSLVDEMDDVVIKVMSFFLPEFRIWPWLGHWKPLRVYLPGELLACSYRHHDR